MQTAVVYYSKHHGNTKKLLDAIKSVSSDEITLFDATKTPPENLEEYDLIGFASGIYYSKFQKNVLEFARNHTPSGKKVFLIYTCGVKKDGYTKAIREALAGTNANILGEFDCLGFDTFGPFKLVGGIAKNHPTASEIHSAVSFYDHLCK